MLLGALLKEKDLFYTIILSSLFYQCLIARDQEASHAGEQVRNIQKGEIRKEFLYKLS